MQSRRHQEFRGGLLAFETALASLLLVGAGLLLKTFVALYAVDMGFEPRNLSRFSLIVPTARYDLASRSGSSVKAWGSTLSATSRSSLVSLARYTSPMPPSRRHSAAILSSPRIPSRTIYRAGDLTPVWVPDAA